MKFALRLRVKRKRILDVLDLVPGADSVEEVMHAALDIGLIMLAKAQADRDLGEPSS